MFLSWPLCSVEPAASFSSLPFRSLTIAWLVAVADVGLNQVPGRRRAAYEYGPSLLVAVPSTVAAWDNNTGSLDLHGVDPEAPASWLTPDPAAPMRFNAKASVAMAGTVMFRPYFEVGDELMTAYPAYDVPGEVKVGQ